MAHSCGEQYHRRHISMRVLLVEDEPQAAHIVAKGLREHSYAVDITSDGAAALFQLSLADYDAVVLDVMLPIQDGFAVCRAIRQAGRLVPILMVTARDAVESRIEGLDSGADDYLVKPFALAELAARLRALLRRATADSSAEEKPTYWRVADLDVDLTVRRVTRAGRAIDLTPREFDLLIQLLRNAGRIVSRETLAREVWQEIRRATPLDNVIDVHIARLRRKIDDGFACRLIHTVRGLGFVLREEPGT